MSGNNYLEHADNKLWSEEDSDVEANLGFEREFTRNEKYFKIKKSAASCKIDDIVGFIYGGQSSRFWMLRKYLISIPAKEDKLIALRSWNCITLQLKNRDVDLVI